MAWERACLSGTLFNTPFNPCSISSFWITVECMFSGSDCFFSFFSFADWSLTILLYLSHAVIEARSRRVKP